jgi:hypothetical protein
MTVNHGVAGSSPARGAQLKKGLETLFQGLLLIIKVFQPISSQYTDSMSQYWNERFSSPEYRYGEQPNVFFAEQLGKLKPGKVILACEGEGRNATWAAAQGWETHAFDGSEKGREKALLLAARKGVTFDYRVEDAVTVDYPKHSVDAVAFVFAHFPSAIRQGIHRKAITWLKPGGYMILEGFNPLQLQNGNTSGGPQEMDMLYTEAMLQDDFRGLKPELLLLVKTSLDESPLHQGMADLIRFVGIK